MSVHSITITQLTICGQARSKWSQRKEYSKSCQLKLLSCEKFLTNYYLLDLKSKKKLVLFLIMIIINLTKIKRRI